MGRSIVAPTQSSPGRIALNSANLNANRPLMKTAASAPVAILTGGHGQDQCKTCTIGNNYVLTQTNTSCPQGNCTFKFIGSPNCGSGGPSCWQLVSGSNAPSPAANSQSSGNSVSSPAPVPSYRTSLPSTGPSWSRPNTFSDDLQSWLRSSGEDPWSAPSPRPTAEARAPRQNSQPVASGDTGSSPSTSSSDSALSGGDEAARLNALEQNIWDSADGVILDYQSQFGDDVAGAAKTFAKLERDRLRENDQDLKSVQQNLGYAIISGGTNAAIDTYVPKTGDPLQDTMNTSAHILDKMPILDWTLSGVRNRIKDVATGLTGNFKSNLDTVAQQIGDFKTTP